VDVGAGAGIPGLPLRIVDPGIALTLVEARQRRVSFLRTVKRELGLEDVAIFAGRAEVMRDEIVSARGPFDCVVARSVAPIDELAPMALGYLKIGGMLIASGPPADRPLQEHRDGRFSMVIREFPALGLKRTFVTASRQA
jgi:16S rRNA (guanine527-N7)-methyltransferase